MPSVVPNCIPATWASNASIRGLQVVEAFDQLIKSRAVVRDGFTAPDMSSASLSIAAPATRSSARCGRRQYFNPPRDRFVHLRPLRAHRSAAMRRYTRDSASRLVGPDTGLLECHLEAFTGAGLDAPVSTGPELGPLRRATRSRAWRSAVRKANAPAGLRLHDLRHHAATLAARMPGITTKEPMARIGHDRLALGSDLPARGTRERDEAVAGSPRRGGCCRARRLRRATFADLRPAARWGCCGVSRTGDTQSDARGSDLRILLEGCSALPFRRTDGATDRTAPRVKTRALHIGRWRRPPARRTCPHRRAQDRTISLVSARTASCSGERASEFATAAACSRDSGGPMYETVEPDGCRTDGGSRRFELRPQPTSMP